MKSEDRMRYIVPVVLVSAVGGLLAVNFLKSRKLFYWKYKGKKYKEIRIVCNSQDWEAVHPHLLSSCQQFRVIGFDCEWIYHVERPPRPVALMQLATHQGFCTLIRLCKFKQTIPTSLVQILQDPSIMKVGVGIIQDAKRLEKDYGLAVNGCLDLRYIVDNHPKFNSIKERSLQGLAKHIINVDLDKSVNVRCSNWEAHILTSNQIVYAANDALVAVDIAEQLSLPDNNLWSRLFGSVTSSELMDRLLKLANGAVDKNYRVYSPPKTTGVMPKRRHQEKNQNLDASEIPKISTQKTISRVYSARKKELYHNCQLQAPDGQLLSMCDVKKAQWYLDKDLADLVCEEPLTVCLKFEPVARSNVEDGTYNTLEKYNICVVCGKADSYIRKNVVPQEYRRHFPLCMKYRQSHDILLLCLNCHQNCSAYDSILRRELAEECSAPFGTCEEIKNYFDPLLTKVRSSARALLLNRNDLPDGRREELTNFLNEYYAIDHINEELLQEASTVKTKIANEDFIPHGLKVVCHMAQKGNLLHFEKCWRQHFLTTMRPQNLPRLWSVDHNHKRLEKKGIDVNQAFLQAQEKF